MLSPRGHAGSGACRQCRWSALEAKPSPQLLGPVPAISSTSISSKRATRNLIVWEARARRSSRLLISRLLEVRRGRSPRRGSVTAPRRESGLFVECGYSAQSHRRGPSTNGASASTARRAAPDPIESARQAAGRCGDHASRRARRAAAPLDPGRGAGRIVQQVRALLGRLPSRP